MNPRLTRRQLLRLGLATGAGMALSRSVPWAASPAFAWAQSGALKKFVQPLRNLSVFDPSGIPVAASDGTRTWTAPATGTVTATHYTIDVGQFEDQLHPDLPNPTRLWGYNPAGSTTPRHLGGIIAAKRDEAVQITFRNNLPGSHIIPVDESIMGASGAKNRTATHLHGGLVPWISDGGPFDWWAPDGSHGDSFLNNEVLRPGQTVPINEAEYYYPNNQGSRMVWYHDHAFGITRINAYAGIASGLVIYDDATELGLVGNNGLPPALHPRTVYLVFQDKTFVSSSTSATDPTWSVPGTRSGDLWYAHVYDTARFGPLGPAPSGPPPDPSIVPEFFGDTMLVNGTVSPYLVLEQRQYRFRMLNACNARFLNPRLVYAKGPTFPDSTEPTNQLGPGFIQIGTEGGFLPQPALVSGPQQPLLLMAPAERADVIVDLSAVPAGSILLLYNDAPAPFPGGDPRNDYYPGNNKTPSSSPGFSPNTRTLLQIRVVARSGAKDAPFGRLKGPITPTDPFLVKQTLGVPTPIPAGVPVRRLTLNEEFDEHGRLAQTLGTDVPTNPGVKTPIFGLAYASTQGEHVANGSTEVWEIVNLSADTHPIHFHLVNVQILSRQAFSAKGYVGGVPNYVGQPIAPDANEMGWKETVRMNPGEVTRVIMKFDLAQVPFDVPPSPRTGGHEFVWHCHILEHEEHDMMHALVVT